MTYLLPAALLLRSAVGNMSNIGSAAERMADADADAWIKIRGGYSGWAAFGRIRTVLGGVRGGSFEAWGARAGRGPAARSAANANGGIPPFFAGADRSVGTAASERQAQAVGIARFSGARRKLHRLSSEGLAGLAGAIAQPRPAPPQSRSTGFSACGRSRFSGFGTALRPRARLIETALADEGRETSSSATGSGVRAALRSDGQKAGDGAISRTGERVGDGASPALAAMSDWGVGARLWGGRGHVNA